MHFSGHLISRDGIQPPPERVQAIQDYPSPKSVKELRRAIGLLNWFRKYIPNFSSEIEPLTKLLRKNTKFRWTSEQEIAFQKLKQLLLNSPVLAFPNYDIPFHLAVDTSSKGIGYVLYQTYTDEKEEESMRVVRFGSKSLSRWQRSYGPTKLELFGNGHCNPGLFSIFTWAQIYRGMRPPSPQTFISKTTERGYL